MKPNKDVLHEHLSRYGQEHLLAHWSELSDSQQLRLVEQLEQIDLSELDQLARHGASAEDWHAIAARATAPPAIRLNDSKRLFDPERAATRGMEALADGEVGVILVAGGQGTRLGSDRPKGTLPIGPVSDASLFQILIEKVIARARVAQMRIPLYLMTSPATHQPTLEFLAQNENFGLPRADLHVFCQGTMPAVDAETRKILLSDKHELALSPDGHGGMLAALAKSGGLEDARGRGLKYLFYCQVDNPLVNMSDPEFLGYHILSRSEMSTLVVAKQTPRDKVGNVVTLDGRLRIMEYSDLNSLPDEALTRTSNGEPVFWAGSIAVHVFDVDFLSRQAQSATALPFHTAKKAVACLDQTGGRTQPGEPNAIKFERFVFDLLPAANNGIVVETPEAETFAPVKNAPGDLKDTPESVQAQMIALYTRWLAAAGCQVSPGVAVEISPLFAQNAQETAARIRPGMTVTEPRYFC